MGLGGPAFVTGLEFGTLATAPYWDAYYGCGRLRRLRLGRLLRLVSTAHERMRSRVITRRPLSSAMTLSELDTPNRWQLRAAQLRTIADMSQDERLVAILLRLAAEYERRAQRGASPPC